MVIIMATSIYHMGFTEQKKKALNDLLAAEKVGDLDMELKPILDDINSLADYYTTSSCFGRVVLMEDLGGKGKDKFAGKWHRKVKPDEVITKIKPCEGVVWFRYESPIIHVMAKTPKKAAEFLHKSREAGFKRSGIQTLKDERILIEVLSTERIDAPVMALKKRLVPNEYVKFLVIQANKKFDAGERKINKLKEKLVAHDSTGLC
jgi:tRNA wybutosine-synthesizing protein 3